jgi:hypothetical protein
VRHRSGGGWFRLLAGAQRQQRVLSQFVDLADGLVFGARRQPGFDLSLFGLLQITDPKKIATRWQLPRADEVEAVM